MLENIGIRGAFDLFSANEENRKKNFNEIILKLEKYILDHNIRIASSIYFLEAEDFPTYLNIGPYHKRKINQHNIKHGTNLSSQISEEEYEEIYAKEIKDQREKEQNDEVDETLGRVLKVYRGLTRYAVKRNKIFTRAIDIDMSCVLWAEFDTSVKLIEDNLIATIGSFSFDYLLNNMEKSLSMISNLVHDKLHYLFSFAKKASSSLEKTCEAVIESGQEFINDVVFKKTGKKFIKRELQDPVTQEEWKELEYEIKRSMLPIDEDYQIQEDSEISEDCQVYCDKTLKKARNYSPEEFREYFQFFKKKNEEGPRLYRELDRKDDERMMRRLRNSSQKT